MEVLVKKEVMVLIALVMVLSLSLFPVAAQGSFTLTATTSPATNITNTSAVLNGAFSLSSALPGPFSFTAYFEYGTRSGSYDKTTNRQNKVITSGSLSTGFSQAVANLTPCTTYYGRTVVLMELAKEPADTSVFLASMLTPFDSELRGIGVGMDGLRATGMILNAGPDIYTGNEILFTTEGCVQMVGTGSHGTGIGGFSGFSGPTNTPTLMSNIVVQTAAVSSTKAGPGEDIKVTATLTNKGGSNGAARVTLFVNGQEADARGISLSAGQTSPVEFSLSRNEPGTYAVYVNGVSAGSFTVDQFGSNAVLYISGALLVVALIGGLIYFTRRRTGA
jgi:hypothetical protein